MIQPNDLRIGNYVYQFLTDMASDNYQIIETIGREAVSTHEFNEVIKFEKLHGIPLIPEILLKCRFDLHEGLIIKSFHLSISNFPNKYHVISVSGDYVYIREGNDECRENDSIVTVWNKDIKKNFYLHELQNLYYALTNKELPVNL